MKLSETYQAFTAVFCYSPYCSPAIVKDAPGNDRGCQHREFTSCHPGGWQRVGSHIDITRARQRIGPATVFFDRIKRGMHLCQAVVFAHQPEF